MVQLLFAADLVPTESNENFFISGDATHLFGEELLQVLSRADFRCFNLETSLSREKKHASYPGPYLCAKPETLCAIQRLRPSLLVKSNNHALDFGEKGLKDTLQALQTAGILSIGAGKNREEAARPYIFEADGTRIGIYACTEYEFAAAGEHSWGANPYDPLTSFDEVRQLKQSCDVAIVLYHGGKEFYRYPSPRLQQVCRKFAQYGADLILCQHSHCIGCEETYQQATIVYGQGNFLFDANENEYKMTGLLVQCEVEGGLIQAIHYLPLVKKAETIRLAQQEAANEILAGFAKRSQEIAQPGFIQQAYNDLADRMYPTYVKKLLGKKLWVRALGKLTRSAIFPNYYSPQEALAVLNAISPENHSELLMTALRRKGR